jgi:hypothetical protein
MREPDRLVHGSSDCGVEGQPFRWTKTADDILASIERFCHRTIAVQAQCG